MNVIPFSNHVDMNKNSILNFAVQTLPSAPNDPVLGQVYFDSSLNSFMGYNGTSWDKLTAEEAVDYTQDIEIAKSEAKEEAVQEAKEYTDEQLKNVNVDYKAGFEQVLGLNDTNINNAIKSIAALTQEEKQLIANIANDNTKDKINELKTEILGGTPAEDLDTIKELADLVKSFGDIPAALQALPKKYLELNVGDGVANSNTITHNLGTKFVDVQVYDQNGNRVYTSYTVTDDNNVVLYTGVSPLNKHTVKVLG